jgi:molybdopterin adenylyltransferase
MAVPDRLGIPSARSVIEGFSIVSVNVSAAKGTAKIPAGSCTIDESGVVGDAHRGVPDRGVSILDAESIEQFGAQMGIDVSPGSFGENLTTRGIDLGCLAPGDTLEAGGVLLEVASIGKTCHGDGCDIFRRVGRCVMPSRGVFCRVIREGEVKPGDRGRVVSRRRKCRNAEA